MSDSPTAPSSQDGSLEQRTEIASQGMRGLFLINGGGAVALLVFLQGAWKTIPVLVVYVGAGIATLVAGLIFAASVPFVRIAASLHYERNETDKAKSLSRWHRLLEKLSICAFALGILIVLYGVFTNLPGSALDRAEYLTQSEEANPAQTRPDASEPDP